MADWRTTLQRNWIYMVAATLISVLLWVGVSADTVRQDWISAELVIINGDRRYVLTDREPNRDVVEVLFTGRAGELVTLSVTRPQIFVSIDSVEARTMEVKLRPEMVKGRGARELTDVRPVVVRPDEMRLRFEPRAQKVVRVIPRVRVSAAEGYAIADSVRVQPGSIAVEGPESRIEKVDSLFTVPLTRSGLRETLTEQVPIDRPAANDLVEGSSESVRVTVRIEPREERAFPGVPVAVRGLEDDRLRLEPPLVDVRVTGPRSMMEEVRPDGLRPRVQLNGREDIGRMLPITLPAPGPFVRVQLEPDSARVLAADTVRASG